MPGESTCRGRGARAGRHDQPLETNEKSGGGPEAEDRATDSVSSGAGGAVSTDLQLRACGSLRQLDGSMARSPWFHQAQAPAAPSASRPRSLHGLQGGR